MGSAGGDERGGLGGILTWLFLCTIRADSQPRPDVAFTVVLLSRTISDFFQQRSPPYQQTEVNIHIEKTKLIMLSVLALLIVFRTQLERAGKENVCPIDL